MSSPVEYIVGSLRALEMLDPPPSTLLLAEWTTRMGQALFYPPNVFGWPGGRSWLTTRTVISRANFATALIDGGLHNPVRPLDTVQLAKRYGFETREQQQGFLGELLVGVECDIQQQATGESLDDYVSRLLASPH